MFIFGGRKGDRRLNDMYIWHISVPRASYQDCSLREEIVFFYKNDYFKIISQLTMWKNPENFADVEINGNLKQEYKVHSYVLKARCKYLFRKIEQKNDNRIVL